MSDDRSVVKDSLTTRAGVAIDTTIIPLAEAAGLRIGETANVLLTSASYRPRMEILTDVRVKREHGVDWLILEWKPGAATEWGTHSCGFGGWKIDEGLEETLRAMARERTR